MTVLACFKKFIPLLLRLKSELVMGKEGMGFITYQKLNKRE